MVILRIVCVNYCDFAIVCDISSISHYFAFYRFFPSDMGPLNTCFVKIE